MVNVISFGLDFPFFSFVMKLFNHRLKNENEKSILLVQ